MIPSHYDKQLVHRHPTNYHTVLHVTMLLVCNILNSKISFYNHGEALKGSKFMPIIYLRVLFSSYKRKIFETGRLFRHCFDSLQSLSNRAVNPIDLIDVKDFQSFIKPKSSNSKTNYSVCFNIGYIFLCLVGVRRKTTESLHYQNQM